MPLSTVGAWGPCAGVEPGRRCPMSGMTWMWEACARLGSGEALGALGESWLHATIARVTTVTAAQRFTDSSWIGWMRCLQLRCQSMETNSEGGVSTERGTCGVIPTGPGHYSVRYTIFTKSSPLYLPEPQSPSRSVHGLAAMDSSSDFPDALSFRTRSAAVESMSRYFTRSVLVASGPWPGTILVPESARLNRRSDAAIMPSTRPPVLPSM